MRNALLTMLLSALCGCTFAAAQQTWTGYVTDTHCGTHCQVTSTMKPDLGCVRRCVKQGSKYGLWTGNKVYVLEPQAKAAAFAAQNVRVTGTLERDVIRMDDIKPAPPSAVPQQP